MSTQTTVADPVSSLTARRLLRVISKKNPGELSRALYMPLPAQPWERALTTREVEALDTLHQVTARLHTLLPTLAAEHHWDIPELDAPVTILKSLAS